MKKITLIKSLLGFSLIGGAFLTTALTTTNCGGSGGDTPEPPFAGYSQDGTNWVGHISGTLQCSLNFDNTCTITSSSNYKADETFTIPETIVVDDTEYTITSIGSDAFRNSLITGLNLNGVTSVGLSAFQDSKNLTKVNLGNCASLSGAVFYGCDKLTQVDLNNVTSLLSFAFGACALSSVTVSPTNPVYKWVGIDSHNGFLQKKSDDAGTTLTPACGQYGGGVACGNITIPSSIATIDDFAFANSNGLTSVNFSNTTTILEQVFLDCGNLTEINLNSVTEIGSSCFSSCPLSSVTVSPINTAFTWVGLSDNNGFIQRKSDPETTLTPVCGTYGGIACGNIVIENSIVANYAMAECAGLTQVTCFAPTIGIEAFSRCANLNSFDCSAGLNTIGNSAFANCSSLQDIYLSYATTIGNEAFKNCMQLTQAYLWAAETIGANAFAGCINLTELELGGELTSIGPDAFKECPLQSVYLWPNNTTFNWNGDQNNGFLQKISDEYHMINPACGSPSWSSGGVACGHVVISSSVTTIAQDCFNSAAGITSIDLSASTSIEFGYNWCADCRNLSSITIGASTIYAASQYDEWSNVGANAEECFLYCSDLTAANNFKANIIKSDSEKWQIIIQ